MADDNVLKVQIQLDDGTVKQAFAKIEDEGKSSFQKIGEYAGGILTSQAITAAFDKIRGIIAESINTAAEYGAEVQKLNGNLALSGRYSDAASKTFTDLADSIQRTTAFSDDQVLSIAALGSNFTHSNEQTKKLTQTTLDFAAATGQDANEAAQKLALTLQGNIGRLGRYFPELKRFTESQLEAGAAVNYLSTRFQGAAEAQSGTYSASISQLGNAFADFLKSIGQLITESPTVIGTLKFLAETLLNTADSINAFRGGGDIFRDFAKGAISAGIILTEDFGRPIERVANLILGLTTIMGASEEVFIGFGLRSFDTIKIGLKNLKDGLANFPTVLKDAFNGDGTDTSTKVLAALLAYNDAIDLAAVKGKSFKNQVIADQSVLAGSVTPIFDTLKDVPLTFSRIMEVAAESYGDAIDKIVETTREGLAQSATQAFQGFSNAVSSGFAAIGKALVKGQNVFQAFAGALLSGLGQAAIQLGSFYLLLGLARAFSSYGLDGTAFELIGVGTALTVLGGALSAFGEGVTGTSNPATSVNTGGGSAVDTSASTSSGTATSMTPTQQQGITVNIQGDVLDSRETGLRIVDLINDTFNASGAKVAYS